MAMRHPVREKVQAVRRRAWCLRAVCGGGLWLSAAISALLIAAVVDYGLRLDDVGVRLLSSTAVAAVCLAAFWRYVIPLFVRPESELETAQRIEQRFPEWGDRLSSAVAFLARPASEPTSGSAELRREVVRAATADLGRWMVADCLDARRPRQIAILAVAICGLAALAAAWDRPAAALAVRRLAAPWSVAPWPRRNQLQFVKAPRRLAFGSDFEVELVDGANRLPSSVQIKLWFDGDPVGQIQAKEMKFFHNRMVYRLDKVQRPFRYRAVGGDDDTMPWQTLELVEPPQIAELEIRLHPPAYTGWPSSASGKNIRALEGAVIEAAGRLTRPATAVRLRTDRDPPTAPGISARVSEDGLRFSLAPDADPPWVASDSATYWFEATDPEGLRGGADQRWNLQVIPDSPPSVALDQPAANASVTADAVVPLVGSVKDDLAIRTIAVRFVRNGAADGQEHETITIYRGPAKAPPAPRDASDAGGESGETRAVDFAWNLAEVVGLEPGEWIDFELTADDYRPQSAQSSARRLTIISVRELEERLAARQAFVLGQLAELLRMQRDARAPLRSLEIGWTETGRLNVDEVDQLQAVELKQRQVGQLVTDPQQGVAAQIVGLMHELQSNRIATSEVSGRMNQLLTIVRQIGDEQLPAIEAALIDAVKLACEAVRTAAADDSSGAVRDLPSTVVTDDIQSAARAAGHGQDEVISRLEALLEDFSQWDGYRRFSRELLQLRESQDELRRDTARTRLELLAGATTEPDAERRANLRRLADRQHELAREFDKLQSGMDQMRAGLDPEDPATQTLADALEVARRTAVGGQMREAGRQIDDNQLGDAGHSQQEILEHLRELLDTLANRRARELERRAAELEAARQALRELRDQLGKMQAQVEQAATQTDVPQQRQQLDHARAAATDMADQTRRLSRRAERLQAESAAQSLSTAATALDQAAAAAAQGEAAPTAAHACEAERLLEQADAHLDGARLAATQQTAQEQLRRLERQVTDLAAAQLGALHATIAFDKGRQGRDQWTRADLSAVGGLARRQRAIETEAAALAEQMASSPVFALGLRGALREMERAARGLERRETAVATQQTQHEALARLQQMQKALKLGAASSPERRTSDERDDSDSPPEAGRHIAELELLKSLQQEILRRTAELERSRENSATPTDEQAEALRRLADDQGRLAALIEAMQ